ncbi:hypothetical protein ACIGFK_04135 [Streptomyces sp. NPDC085524]
MRGKTGTHPVGSHSEAETFSLVEPPARTVRSVGDPRTGMAHMT